MVERLNGVNNNFNSNALDSVARQSAQNMEINFQMSENAAQAQGLEVEKPEKDDIPKATGDGKNISVKVGNTEIAKIKSDTGLSSDAVLHIEGGGKWEFEQADGYNGDWWSFGVNCHLNYDEFETEKGRIVTKDYPVGKLINVNNGRELEVRTNDNNTMDVKYEGTWYALEDFIQIKYNGG